MTLAVFTATFLAAYSSFQSRAGYDHLIPPPEQQVDRVIRESGGNIWLTTSSYKVGQRIGVGYICRDLKTVQTLSDLYDKGDFPAGNAVFAQAVRAKTCLRFPPSVATVLKAYPKIYHVGTLKGQVYKIRIGKLVGYILLQV